jgi:hypothetical protein
VSSSGYENVRGSEHDLRPLLALVDVSLGLTSILAELTLWSVRTTRDVAAPVVRVVDRLPGARTASAALARSPLRRGASVRVVLASKGPRAVDLVVPVLLEQVLSRVDLADVVHRHVDLDRIVADVDIDAIAARLDVDTVAARLDIDTVAARLDFATLVTAALTQLDLAAIAEQVIDAVDLDHIVADVDIDAIAARLDVDAVAARLDFATLVTAALAQIDLVAIAEQVIDAVDLPEIIRESSGALTSDTVRSTRMRSAAADQALARVRDRLLHHRDGARGSAAPAASQTALDGSELRAPSKLP